MTACSLDPVRKGFRTGKFEIRIPKIETNPNLEKKHKPYCYLVAQNEQILIGGITEEQMEEERYQTGTYCKHCKTVIYSVMRHDYRACKCKDNEKQIHVDGGKDYFKFSWGKEASYDFVKIDFKTGQIEITDDCRNKKDIEIDEKADKLTDEEENP